MNKLKTIALLISILMCFVGCEKKIYNRWIEKDGRKYYYDEKGEIVKNKSYIIDGNTYYFLETGEMATGLVQEGAKKRYYDDNGRLMKNRIVKSKGAYLLADKDGEIVKNGWYKWNEYWYYAKDTVLKTGWFEDNGSWYYFNSACSMCVNQWVDNDYYVGNDGKMLTNTTKDINGKTYVFDASGKKSELKLPPGQAPIKLKSNGYELIVEKFPNTLWANDCMIKINEIDFKANNLHSGVNEIECACDFTVLQLYYSNTNTVSLYYKLYDPDNYLIKDDGITSFADNLNKNSNKNIKAKGQLYLNLGTNKGTYKLEIYSYKEVW